MTNPLLEDSELPRFRRCGPEHVCPAITELIERQRASIAALVALGRRAHLGHGAGAAGGHGRRLNRAWAPGHAPRILCATSRPLREAHNQALTLISSTTPSSARTAAVRGRCAGVSERPDFGFLTPAQRKIVDDALRDFRLSGVALTVRRASASRRS
jgi:oligopeptidase A